MSISSLALGESWQVHYLRGSEASQPDSCKNLLNMAF
jgi:hypothetical protein